MLDALRRRGLLHSQTAALDPQLSDNALGPDGADAFGGALRRNSHLERIQLAGNGFEDGAALGEALAAHPTLREADLSSNNIALVPIASQLKLGRKSGLSVDLSNNPLSSLVAFAYSWLGMTK